MPSKGLQLRGSPACENLISDVTVSTGTRAEARLLTSETMPSSPRTPGRVGCLMCVIDCYDPVFFEPLSRVPDFASEAHVMKNVDLCLSNPLKMNPLQTVL